MGLIGISWRILGLLDLGGSREVWRGEKEEVRE